jgi:hypothetical protein
MKTLLILALMTTAAHAEDAIKRDPAINWNLHIEPSQERTLNDDKKKVVTAVGILLILGAVAVAVATGGQKGE